MATTDDELRPCDLCGGVDVHAPDCEWVTWLDYNAVRLVVASHTGELRALGVRDG